MNHKNYNAIKLLILKSLTHESDATIENVLACLVSAENNLRECNFEIADKWLQRAAQRVWGSFPPEQVKVSDNWIYTLRS